MGRPKGAGEKAVKHRNGSKASMIDAAVIAEVQQSYGTPTIIAMKMTRLLRFPVSRMDVWHCLNEHGFTSKTSSIVPALAITEERVAYLEDLAHLWTEYDQV